MKKKRAHFTFQELDMGQQRAEASHLSKLNIEYWGRFCEEEVLESAICSEAL